MFKNRYNRNRFFQRHNLFFKDPEDGQEGGSAAGGETDDNASDDSDTGGDQEEGGSDSDAGAGGDDDSPQSMLDAISDSLGQDQEKDEKGQDGADDKDADKSADDDKAGEKGDGDDADKKDSGDEELSLELTEEEKKELRPKAQERFQSLANAVKERDEQLTSLQGTIEGFRSVITDTKMDSNELAEILEFGKALKAGDHDTAQKMLRKYANEVQLSSGKSFELDSPLADFPDLQAMVDKMEVNEAVALELANKRRSEQRQQEQTQQAQQEEQTQAELKTRYTQAVTSASDWSKQMAANDLNWPAKEKAILGSLNEIVASNVNTPERILPELQRIYRTLDGVVVSGGDTSDKPADKHQQPLSKGARGGGNKEPASMLDAITTVLG